MCKQNILAKFEIGNMKTQYVAHHVYTELYMFLLIVFVDALCPSQHVLQSSQDNVPSSWVETEDTVPCSRALCSASGESPTSDPSISSLTLYH